MEQAGRTANFSNISLWNFQQTQNILSDRHFSAKIETSLKSGFLSATCNLALIECV